MRVAAFKETSVINRPARFHLPLIVGYDLGVECDHDHHIQRIPKVSKIVSLSQKVRSRRFRPLAIDHQPVIGRRDIYRVAVIDPAFKDHPGQRVL